MTRAKCYQILQLKPGATEEEIRKQYKRMALKVHPDINPSPKANEEFIQLTRAVEVLLSPEKSGSESRSAQRKSNVPETEAQLKARMEQAKMRFEQQRHQKIKEDTHYYEQLTSGKRWMYFKWVVRISWIFVLALVLDLVLPSHFEEDELLTYSSNDHNGILFDDISSVAFKNTGRYFLETRRSYWINSYPEVLIEKTWLLHTPIRVYTSDDFDVNETGVDFHLGAIRWLLIAVFCIPIITYFRQRKDLTFVFLYQFSFWGIGILLLYLLLTQNRLGHLLSLGFL